jgi:hypothetical protein
VPPKTISAIVFADLASTLARKRAVDLVSKSENNALTKNSSKINNPKIGRV